MRYRVKLAAVLLSVLLAVFVVDTIRQARNTLVRLDAVEAERDGWQRPAEIIAALNLKPGSTVVDLGSGSGYFTLRLSPAVRNGSVYAVDIRRLPLAFLWMRARQLDNVHIVLGEPSDPRLPPATDAVLIVNTFHELDNAAAVLSAVFRALRPGGTLVVAEPQRTERGERSAAAVAMELRESGFEILRCQNGFTEQPLLGPWWLIAAVRP